MRLAELLADRPTWQDRAACDSTPTELWFPTKDVVDDETDEVLEEGDPNNHGAEAKKVCARCPVIEKCLVYALEKREEHGIWGGAGEPTRRLLGRLYRARTESLEAEGRWFDAIEAHIDQVRGLRSGVLDRNGPGATHGIRITYARGCRCAPCKLAAAMYGAEQRIKKRTEAA